MVLQKKWDEYQKAQAAQYQQMMHAQQVAAHYNTPQRGYAGFDTSIAPPVDELPVPPVVTEAELEKKRAAKIMLDVCGPPDRDSCLLVFDSRERETASFPSAARSLRLIMGERFCDRSVPSSPLRRHR